MSDEQIPKHLQQGFIGAVIANTLYGAPLWLIFTLIADKSKAIVEQSGGVLIFYAVAIGVLFFANWRVYQLAAAVTFKGSLGNYLKLAWVGPWVNSKKI